MKNCINLAMMISFFAVPLVGLSFKQKANKPNVIFIAVDDLRPALGCYGDKLAITPNIDKLAKKSIVFTQHYVQAPSCAPSRTSMLTGLRPDEVKVTNHITHFRETKPNLTTLPQFFKNNGYKTISLGKIFHYAKGYNDPVSWHEEHFLQGEESPYFLEKNLKVKGKASSMEMVDFPDTVYTDGKITRKAIECLKTFKANDESFFLGVGFLKPHLPFNAPKKYWDMYNRDDFGNITNPDRPVGAPDIAFHNSQELRGYKDIPDNGPLDHEKEKQLRHAYYACVSYIDAQVGKLLQTLEELGLRENTIIVLWGDHGYHLGEQDLWCKSTNFDLSAHAPLIISAPEIGKKGFLCNALAESVDLYPTILDLCGFEGKGNLSGVSLKPLMLNPSLVWNNEAFNQFARPYEAAIGAKVPATHMGYSVRTEKWRYTAWYNLDNNTFEYPELYSFQNPGIPYENLAGNPENSDIQKRFHSLIKKYQNGKFKKEAYHEK